VPLLTFYQLVYKGATWKMEYKGANVSLRGCSRLAYHNANLLQPLDFAFCTQAIMRGFKASGVPLAST
jgi:hypothetical protein